MSKYTIISKGVLDPSRLSVALVTVGSGGIADALARMGKPLREVVVLEGHHYPVEGYGERVVVSQEDLAITMLVTVARAAHALADNTCEQEVDGENMLTLEPCDFDDLAAALDALDTLPEIAPNIYGTGPAKAEALLTPGKYGTPAPTLVELDAGDGKVFLMSGAQETTSESRVDGMHIIEGPDNG